MKSDRLFLFFFLCPIVLFAKDQAAALDWVAIQGGPFKMGISLENMKQEAARAASNKALVAQLPRELPEHEVLVDDFEILRHEVTVEEYAKCVEENICKIPPNEAYCSYFQKYSQNLPVNCVDWNNAAAFCRWADARLPSEKEWEFAARSRGKAYRYPWGNSPEATCEYAVVDEHGRGCGKKNLWPACSKPKGNTEQGLCDMAGNAWEWVQDLLQPYPGYTDAAHSLQGQSKEIFFDGFRVIRGGGIGSFRDYRTSLRGGHRPDFKYGGLSFRCVRVKTGAKPGEKNG